MRALIVVTIFVLATSSATAQEVDETAWWATADFWKAAAPFFGAFLGFFGATFVNDWLQRRRAFEDRRQAAIALAVALKGEVLAAANSYKRRHDLLRHVAREWEDGGNDRYKEDAKISVATRPAIASNIYIANIEKMGLLEDPVLIANLTQFYSAVDEEEVKSEYRASFYGELCEKAAEANEVARRRAMDTAQQLQQCADSF